MGVAMKVTEPSCGTSRTPLVATKGRQKHLFVCIFLICQNNHFLFFIIYINSMKAHAKSAGFFLKLEKTVPKDCLVLFYCGYFIVVDK